MWVTGQSSPAGWAVDQPHAEYLMGRGGHSQNKSLAWPSLTKLFYDRSLVLFLFILPHPLVLL